MMNACTAWQRNYATGRDAARREAARGLPPPVGRCSEARRALAPDCLITDRDERMIGAGGALTYLMLDVLICGRLVYSRNECATRYRSGAPNRLLTVFRWLLLWFAWR